MGDNRNNSHDSRMWFGGAGGGRSVREHPGPRALRLAQRERQRRRLVARGRAGDGPPAPAAVGDGARAAARPVSAQPPRGHRPTAAPRELIHPVSAGRTADASERASETNAEAGIRLRRSAAIDALRVVRALPRAVRIRASILGAVGIALARHRVARRRGLRRAASPREPRQASEPERHRHRGPYRSCRSAHAGESSMHRSCSRASGLPQSWG